MKLIGRQVDFEPLSASPEDSGASSKYRTLSYINDFVHVLCSGILNQARNVTVKGGNFYNIQGNFSSRQPGIPSQ